MVIGHNIQVTRDPRHALLSPLEIMLEGESCKTRLKRQQRPLRQEFVLEIATDLQLFQCSIATERLHPLLQCLWIIEIGGSPFINKAKIPAPRQQQTFPNDIGSPDETPLYIDPAGIHTRFNLGTSLVHSLAYPSRLHWS